VSLRRRVERLEERGRYGVRGGRCPECGLRPQEKGYIVLEEEIVGEVRDPVPELPEVCARCGRSTRIRIVVVEESPGEGAAVGV
jgi:rRNA maturation protein Nop10